MLSIAAEMFGIQKIYAVEMDSDAIKIFNKNIEEFQLENIEILNKDVMAINKEDF